MKKFLLTVVILLLVGGLCAGGYYWQRQKHLDEFGQAPFGNGEAKIVLIPPGTGPKPLARLLASNQVISNGDDFFAWVRRAKVAPKLKAGEYQFDLPITPTQIVAKLASGQQVQYHFTVPEGLRVDEILPILSDSELHLKLDRLEALSKDKAFIKKVGVPAGSLEGFLYPDTYSFTHGFTEETVLAKMVARTLEEYRKADGQRKPGNALDLMQTMTLASIVEKETGQPDERPRIACVFHNRLRLKMKLQTDPTVLYAMMLIRESSSRTSRPRTSSPSTRTTRTRPTGSRPAPSRARGPRPFSPPCHPWPVMTCTSCPRTTALTNSARTSSATTPRWRSGRSSTSRSPRS